MTLETNPDIPNIYRMPAGRTDFDDNGAYAESVQFIDDPALYFYVSEKLRKLLKITKVNTKRGLVVYIRDSVDDILPARHHARVYTRDELIDVIAGPLAARFKEGGDNLPILRKINSYVYGDAPDASTFNTRELKALSNIHDLLLSSSTKARSDLTQMLEHVSALFAPHSEEDAESTSTAPQTPEQPLDPSPPAHEQDQQLVASLLSALLNERLDRNKILYNFIADQLRAANHPKHYAQYSPLVLEFAAILMIRCGARAGRLLHGPGLADPMQPRFNFFWPSERTCEREIKKCMPGNVIGFDYDAMRRVVTVMMETEDKTGVRGFYCLHMDATDVGSGAVTLTADGRLINGSDLGNLSELAFADYPVNDHEVKQAVEDIGTRWDSLLAASSKTGLTFDALHEFLTSLAACRDLISKSAGEIKAAHVKQHKAKVDADSINPLLTSFADPSTPVEFLAGKIKPGRKQVNQALGCAKLTALIGLTTTHLIELESAWEQADQVMADQNVNNVERLDRLDNVIQAIKALSVYAVKPAGKLVCFSMTDCHYRASAVVARVFVPSEREDVIEHIFQFVSSQLKVMTGQSNLTRSADGGNRPNLVVIGGQPACVTTLLSTAKFTAMRSADEYLLEHQDQCFAAIDKVQRAGGIGFKIPGPNGSDPVRIQPDGWNLDGLKSTLRQFIDSKKPKSTTSAPQSARHLPNIAPDIHVWSVAFNNELLPLFAFPADERRASKMNFGRLVPPSAISPRFDRYILAQQKDPEYSQRVVGCKPSPTVPPASHTPATPFRLDRDALIALGTQCRALVMAAERFEVDEAGVISGDGCLLQRLWIPVSGEIAVFDWAHVAKRFAIAVSEAEFGPTVPSPKVKKREAKKAASANGSPPSHDGAGVGNVGGDKGDKGNEGNEDGSPCEDGQLEKQDSEGGEGGEDGEGGEGDRLDTRDHVDANPAVHDGTGNAVKTAASKVFEKFVTVPKFFADSKHLPHGWYARDKQNVPAALRIFKKEVVDEIRSQHPFTAEIVEAFGGMCDAWGSSHLSMAERHERVNHFRRTFYPHIVNAMCRPTGPPEYVCGWHRVTVEAMTNMAESLLLIDEEYVRRNGSSPRMNWVQRAVGTDVLENTFSNERATLGLNPRAEANVTNHDEVKFAVGKTQYLIKVFATRLGAIHDPGFKHRAAGNIKPIGDQIDWGTGGRLAKKMKRARPSDDDENVDEGVSSGPAPKKWRKGGRKGQKIKAKDLVSGRLLRARQYHKKVPQVVVSDGWVDEAE